MALIPQKDQDFVKEKFEKELVSEVKISYFTQRESPLGVPGQECQYCRETRQLLEEVAALSPKIHLEVHDFVAEADKSKEMGIERIPAIVLSAEKSYGLKFYGIPAGYEFASLLEAIIDVSRDTTDLSQETRDALGKLTKKVHIQVFFSPT